MSDDSTDDTGATQDQEAANAAATHTQGAGVPPVGGTSAAADPNNRAYFNTADNVYVASVGRVEDGPLEPEGNRMGDVGSRFESGDAPPGSDKVDPEKLAEAQRQADATRSGQPIGAAVEVTPPAADPHAVGQTQGVGDATEVPQLADAGRLEKDEAAKNPDAKTKAATKAAKEQKSGK